MEEFHALLVEGVPGIGKSTLIDALIRRHVSSSEERRIRSFVHLAQTHTYGPLAPAEDAGTLTVADNLRLLDRIVAMLEWLREQLRYSGKPCFVLVDSLHLTHCVRPGVVAWSDVAPIDRRLAAAGCKLLLLKGSDETIRTRTIEARAGSQFLAEYALRFSRTHEELRAHFVREQAAFLGMFEKSAMQKRVCENDRDLDTIVAGVFDFWRPSQEAPGRFLTANA
ncbi:MAG: hypothetical protein WBC67_09925 [Candidatus Acidiferrales bacterium]